MYLFQMRAMSQVLIVKLINYDITYWIDTIKTTSEVGLSSSIGECEMVVVRLK